MIYKIPVPTGSRHGEGLWLIQPWLIIGLLLFSLAAGEDDSGSAENEDSANDVEDRGTDAAGGGEFSALLVHNRCFECVVGCIQLNSRITGGKLLGIRIEGDFEFDISSLGKTSSTSRIKMTKVGEKLSTIIHCQLSAK